MAVTAYFFMMKSYYVYILTNIMRTTLYIGFTGDIGRRHLEHKSKESIKSFSARYNLGILVYCEEFGSAIDGIDREKQLKRWKKGWKWSLIKQVNPKLHDLSGDFLNPRDLLDYQRRL